MKNHGRVHLSTLPAALRGVALASAFCCAGLASAQSTTGSPTVTLYGLLDAGVTYTTGYRGGAALQLASGIMEGSRWGLKGSEDLGGGYRTVFTLESRFELDTGAVSNVPYAKGSNYCNTPPSPLLAPTYAALQTLPQLSDKISSATNLGLPLSLQPVVCAVDQQIAAQYGVNLAGNLFDRQAFVGMVTPVGAFLAGRQYTPGYETFATFDTMHAESALSAGQAFQFPGATEIRRSNSLAYRAQYEGFSGAAMWAAGEVSGNNAANQLWGINASYKSEQFGIGAGYNATNNDVGQKSLATAIFGANLNFDTSTINTMVLQAKDNNPSGVSGIGKSVLPLLTAFGLGAAAVPTAARVQQAFTDAAKQDGILFNLGYRFVTGPNTIAVAYNQYNDKTSFNADVTTYGAAYSYALSKRTDLNAILVRFDNKNLAQQAPGGNGYLGGSTSNAATDSTALALGIRHRF